MIRFNAVAGGKYKVRILWTLRDGPKRYSDLQRALVAATGGARIAPRVLSRELRQLTDASLIARKQFPEVPPRVEYTLRPDGRALMGVMRAICKWGS